MALASPEAPRRPAGDILGRVIRITLSGQEFRLPVRSIKANREWKAKLDAESAGVVNALVEAGDDWEKVLAALQQDVEPFIDLLVSYAPDVLSRDAIEEMEPDPSRDVIDACREVWLAASPLVGIAVESLMADLVTSGSPPTSSPPPSTAGSTMTWRPDSPTSSSSTTSTPPRTESGTGAPPTSTNGYSPSEPEPSTPTTPRRSSVGGGRRKAATARKSAASPGKPSRSQS